MSVNTIIEKISSFLTKAWNGVRQGDIASLPGGAVAGKVVRNTIKYIPAVLLLCEISEKGGLSALAITSSIISRLNEAGIISSLNPDGSPNLINAYTRIAVEEIVNAIKKDMQVYLVPPPNAIKSVVTGTSPVGPITGTAVNINLETIMGGAN